MIKLNHDMTQSGTPYFSKMALCFHLQMFVFPKWAGEVQDCLNISEDEFKKTMKANVMTPWFLVKAIAKRLRDSESSCGGSVVFLTQIIGAERGLYPGAAAYGTSLGAIHQLVRVSLLFKYCQLTSTIVLPSSLRAAALLLYALLKA